MARMQYASWRVKAANASESAPTLYSRGRLDKRETFRVLVDSRKCQRHGFLRSLRLQRYHRKSLLRRRRQVRLPAPHWEVARQISKGPQPQPENTDKPEAASCC